MTMNFCALCGAPLVAVVPPGDEHERRGCSACARIYYRNPEVHVGCIVCQPDGHTPALLLAQAGRGEKIQAAVLRALGPALTGAAPREEELVLYATLTDAGSEHVFLVFRVPGGCLEAVAAGAAQPPWVPELLARFAAERVTRRFDVYTGHHDGARLRLNAVPTDRGDCA